MGNTIDLYEPVGDFFLPEEAEVVRLRKTVSTLP